MSDYHALALAKAEHLRQLRALWQHGDRVQVLQAASPTFRPIPLYGTVIGQPVAVDLVTLIAVRLDTGACVHAAPIQLRNLTRKAPDQ